MLQAELFRMGSTAQEHLTILYLYSDLLYHCKCVSPCFLCPFFFRIPWVIVYWTRPALFNCVQLSFCFHTRRCLAEGVC